MVSLIAMNNMVALNTSVDVNGVAGGDNGGFLTFWFGIGFQDANGNPTAATFVPDANTPEPSTWGMCALSFLMLSMRCKRKLFAW